MSKLGCGIHKAYLTSRGGGTVYEELPWTSLSYGRRLDDISTATVTIGTSDVSDSCCLALASVRSWSHELAIYRNDVLVWCGPVIEPQWKRGEVTIPARDLFQWFERRTLPTDRSYVATDLATIFNQYVTDALVGDTSPNITCVASLCGILGDREVVAALHPRAADALRELARSGVDFAARGRTILVGGAEVPVAALPAIGEDMLLDAQAQERGLDAATQVTVIGDSSGVLAAPYVGVAGGFNATYGLVQQVYGENLIEDDASALAAAQTRLALNLPPPIYLSGILSQQTPADFSLIVPGAIWPVALDIGCLSINATFRLLTVDVRANLAGEDEQISVSLVPEGTT